MEVGTSSPESVQLFLEGSIALSKVEHNGLKIDTQYLDDKITETDRRIKELTEELKEDSTYKIWKRTYGDKTKLGSREQLGIVLFEKLGLTSQGHTRGSEGKLKKRWKTDESVFEDMDFPFVKKWLLNERLKKTKSTYLEGIREEVVDGYLHPSFNLNTVSTFRSSSSNPNFTNLPMRNAEIAELTRTAFIPRKGNVLLEIDYGSLEFKVCGDKWKDPEMISYASDPSKDIHRDMAIKIYKTGKNGYNKQSRYAAKNQFVFPILYGSYYLQCAKNLWESCEKLKLEVDGIPMKEHLKSKGIHSLGKCDPKEKAQPGTFEKHVQDVEACFYELFPVFSDAKEKWWKEYLKRGWFRMMTGFVVSGIYSKNFLMNAPIQGPGFHCLLRSLIHIQRWIEKYRMKTLIVGEIHDCLVLDAPIGEVQDVLNACKYIMTTALQKAWSWVIVPMSVEVDVAETSWWAKKPWEQNSKGEWVPKQKEVKQEIIEGQGMDRRGKNQSWKTEKKMGGI